MNDSPIYMLRSVYADIKYSDLGRYGYFGNVNEKPGDFGMKIAQELAEGYEVCEEGLNSLCGIWIPGKSGELKGHPYGYEPPGTLSFLIPLFQSSLKYNGKHYESKATELCFEINKDTEFEHIGGAGIYAFIVTCPPDRCYNSCFTNQTMSYTEVIEGSFIYADSCDSGHIRIPNFKLFKNYTLLDSIIESIGMYPNSMDKLSGVWNTNFLYAAGLVNPKAHRSPLSHLTTVGLEIEIEKYNESNDYIIAGVEVEEFDDCSVSEHTDTINFDARRIRLFVPIGPVGDGSYIKFGEKTIQLISSEPVAFDCTKPHSAEIKGKMRALIIDLLPKESNIEDRIAYIVQPLAYYMGKEKC